MGSSDLFTISALLVLIIGAACFYLYTRIKQVEKKLTLVEGILLDLKTATEASFLDFPAATSYLLAKDLGAEDDEDDGDFIPESSSEDISGGGSSSAFNDDDVEDLEAAHEEEKHEVQVTKMDDASPATSTSSDDNVNLELLNVKELMAIARSKGLTISKTMRKQQIIDAINAAEGSEDAPAAAAASTEIEGLVPESSFMSGTTLESAPF